MLCALAEAVCRDVPPAGHLLFLRRQEKKAKEGDPTVCVPALRFGQPAVLASSGVSLKLASLRQSRALIRWPLRSSAHTEGMGEPNSRTATRAFASLGPILLAQAPRAGRSAGWVERSDDPCGCPAPVAAPAAGRLRGGMGVAAPMLRHLTRCGCLNEAATQRSEFRSAPRNRHDAGLPRSAAQGSQTWGRPFFGDFLSAKRKKVTALPGALPGSRPMQRHAAKSTHKPQLRQAQPERAGEGLGWCLGFDMLSSNGWGTDRDVAPASTSSARTDGKRTGAATRLRQAQPERVVGALASTSSARTGGVVPRPWLRQAQPERAGALHANTINFIAACAYSISARVKKHSKTQRPAP